MLRSSHSVTQLRRLLAVNFGRNVEEKWLFCSAVNRESRQTGWTASHSFIYLVVFQPSSPSQLPPPITRRLFISRVKHVGDCRRVQWITGRPAACKLSEWCAAESHLPMSSWNGMFTRVRFAVCREKKNIFYAENPYVSAAVEANFRYDLRGFKWIFNLLLQDWIKDFSLSSSSPTVRVTLQDLAKWFVHTAKPPLVSLVEWICRSVKVTTSLERIPRGHGVPRWLWLFKGQWTPSVNRKDWNIEGRGDPAGLE